MKTVTGKVKAWLTYVSEGSVARAAVGDMSVVGFSAVDMSEYGWAYLGEAEVSIKLPDDHQLFASQAEAIRASIIKHQVETAHLERQLQSLLAIEHQPKEVAQ